MHRTMIGQSACRIQVASRSTTFGLSHASGSAEKFAGASRLIISSKMVVVLPSEAAPGVGGREGTVELLPPRSGLLSSEMISGAPPAVEAGAAAGNIAGGAAGGAGKTPPKTGGTGAAEGACPDGAEEDPPTSSVSTPCSFCKESRRMMGN